MDKKLTITDKEIEDLAKAIEEELGFNCFIISGKEKELSEKTRDDSK